MVVQTRGPLKADNVRILNTIRDNASIEYRERIPAATQGNIQKVAQNLHRYRPQWNEFVNALINRIGEVIVRDMSWSNPLQEFKGGMLEYGDTIEEIKLDLIKSRVYDPNREYLEKDIFGTTLPTVESNFHTVNRAEYYPVTVNDNLLRRAFLDSGGLSAFVSQLLAAPSTSDNVDEFLATTALFNTYERNGGFYHVNVPDVKSWDSNEKDAKMALRKVRAMTKNLEFPSTAYNAAHMPAWAKPEDLILFSTPEFQAATDVEALAAAFNLDKMENSTRSITIPEQHFNIPGCQAILTTKDFFVIRDSILETTSSINPVGMHTNYFLHHQQVISASRFAPAVMFHTGADDEVIRISQKPTAVAVPTIEDAEGNTVAANGEVTRGHLYQFSTEVTTDAASTTNAVVWSVTGNTSNRTTISSTGVLNVGWDEGGAELTITAASAGFNDENLRDDAKTASVKVKPSGAIAPEWPQGGKATGFEVAGEHIEISGSTVAWDIESDAEKWTTAMIKDVKVISDGPVSVTKTAAAKVLTVSVDGRYGEAAKAYTFTLKAPVAA